MNRQIYTGYSEPQLYAEAPRYVNNSFLPNGNQGWAFKTHANTPLIALQRAAFSPFDKIDMRLKDAQLNVEASLYH